MSEYEFKDGGSEKTRARLAILAAYIDALTVKPNGPLEVLRAVGFDLIYVAELHGGKLRAAGRGGKRRAQSQGADESS